jgi:hypothetical protein
MPDEHLAGLEAEFGELREQSTPTREPD